MSVYQGEVVGTGEWAPLVSEDAWRACVAILGNPDRKPPRGVKTLLGGLALCPCGNPAMGSVNHLGTHIYRCPPQSRKPGTGPHVARVAADVDRWVTEVVIARLSQPDAVDLLPQRQRVDVAALSAEANAIRARRADLGALYADGAIDRAALITGTARAAARLAELEGKLANAAQESAVAPLLAAADVRAAWHALDLSRQRAVIAALMTVRLLPPGRGRRGFDPASVRVEWDRG
jgi:site-specific DNA recombinase